MVFKFVVKYALSCYTSTLSKVLETCNLVSSWTMETEGTKCIEVAGEHNKQQIAAVMVHLWNESFAHTINWFIKTKPLLNAQ